MVSRKVSRSRLSTLYVRTFNEALAVVGGHPQDLADALSVSARDVKAWIAGTDTPPFTIFADALEIVRAAGTGTVVPSDRHSAARKTRRDC